MLGGLRRLFRSDDKRPGGSDDNRPGGKEIGALEQALLGIAADVWEVEAKTRGQHYPGFEHSLSDEARADVERRLGASFGHLLARWSADDLTRLAAEMYFNSPAWYDRYAWDHTRPEPIRWLLPAQGRVILYVLRQWLLAHPPADIVARLRRRLVELFADPHAAPAVPYPREHPYPPTMQACLEHLQRLDGAEATALVHDLVRGALDCGPRAPERPGMLAGPPAKGYDAFARELNAAVPWMLERLWRAGLYDEPLLEKTLKRFTTALAWASGPSTGARTTTYFYKDRDPEFAALVRGSVEAMARRWAESLDDEENARAIRHLERLNGSFYLLKACEYVERLGLKSLPWKSYRWEDTIAAAVARLCLVARVAEDEAAVVEALRRFRESTLLLVLPVSLQYQDLICRALDWDGAFELVRLVQGVARFDDAASHQRDVRNSADPTSGVLDRTAVLALHARLGEPRFASLVKAFTAHSDGTKNALYLVQAALGKNREKVLDGFARRNQLAVKALGLLPIEHEAEVLRRYVALRQFAREASRFGMERQANERAAAEAALTNLALNAGYADATRLEWAMEDRLGAELGASGREWTVDEHYVVKLEVQAGAPDLTAYKDGKPLRSLPAIVKKHPDYEQMKELTAQLRTQRSRYRAALERAMCRAEELARGELEILARNPVSRPMICSLLLVDEAGALGFYRPDEGAIEDGEGHRHALAGPVRIAHCLDLQRAGALAAWQRELIRRRIVQPFKQVFRELYVVTPAEVETRLFSNRFAGQVVDANRAARLLQAEGWDCVGEDYPRKAFRREGVTAWLTFAESYHYMGEVERLVVDQVCFVPTSAGYWWSGHETRLPLVEVPPLLFSEVMRDVDLVASVAQYTEPEAPVAVGGDGRAFQPSAETVERRADLVRALVADLGLEGVTVDGHFARVKGKLADYRVHLGSAAIHIEPGAYLCVVPSRWGLTHDRLFLPFESTADDLKTSEVISKVLLLSADDKIKDESILQQIRAHRPG